MRVWNWTWFVIILLPVGVAWQLPNSLPKFISAYEFIFEATLLLSSIFAFRAKLNRTKSSNSLAVITPSALVLMMAFWLAADTLFSMRVVFEIPFKASFWDNTGELLYTLFMLSLEIYLLSAYKPWKDKFGLGVSLLTGSAHFLLTYKFILLPFIMRPESPSTFNVINSISYAALSSICTGLVIPPSLRSRLPKTHLFLQGVLLFLISDFAIRYQSAVVSSVSFSWAEPAWASSTALIAYSMLNFQKQTQDSHHLIDSLAPWTSLRTLVGTQSAVTNIVLLLGVMVINLYTVENAYQLTTVLILIYLVWLYSNLLALRISLAFSSVVDSMRVNEDGTPRSLSLVSSSSSVETLKTQGFGHEIDQMIRAYSRLMSGYNELLKRVVSSERNAALAHMSAQVAHDIRSPLAALNMAERDLGPLPEDTRLIIRSAIGRIQDIASQLMLKANAKQGEQGVLDVPSPIEPTLLSSVIETILAEKRMQYRARLGVKIESFLSSNAQALFASVQPREFKRVISNLINNAMEAMNDSGTIELALERSEDVKSVSLKIRDSGKGIPESILKQLGTRGFTHGKDGGSGLGLHHARASLESWGGKLDIYSTPGSGTTVVLDIPICPPPAWFLPSLELQAQSQVVILDDDQSIHQVWQGRMESANATEHGIQLIHFSTPEQLRNWHQSRTAGELNLPTRFLLDYEIIGADQTGLDLIEKLGIAAQSVLVTSRYEEPGIRARCEALSLQLLPKGLAGFVSIAIQQSQTATAPPQPDAVLLDDDTLVHTTWKMVARQKHKTLKAYTDVDAFFSELPQIGKSTPIYIDSNLGKGVRGEEIIQKLSALGYQSLTLATGYDPGPFELKLAGTPGFKSVQDKSPPW